MTGIGTNDTVAVDLSFPLRKSTVIFHVNGTNIGVTVAQNFLAVIRDNGVKFSV